jgi:steroid delta-isomerase-like uncharacterized protein
MEKDAIRTFIHDLADAWQRRDIAAVLQSYTDDSEIVSPIFGTVTGRSAVEASFRDLFAAFTDTRVRVDDVIIDGESTRVFTQWAIRSTHKGPMFGLPGTGKSFDVALVLVLTFHDGRIRREVRIYDFTRLLLELGIMRAKPA